LGYNVFYEGKEDLNVKTVYSAITLGIINQIFKPSLISGHAKTWIYKTLVRPVLYYGNESWITGTDERRMISAEMYNVGYTPSDREEMIRELVIPKMTEFVEQNTRNWKEHGSRISSARTPKNTLKYQQK
jgi:hypothetical protein